MSLFAVTWSSASRLFYEAAKETISYPNVLGRPLTAYFQQPAGTGFFGPHLLVSGLSGASIAASRKRAHSIGGTLSNLPKWPSLNMHRQPMQPVRLDLKCSGHGINKASLRGMPSLGQAAGLESLIIYEDSHKRLLTVRLKLCVLFQPITSLEKTCCTVAEEFSPLKHWPILFVQVEF